ncbi:MAG: hypothetical protein IKG53_10545 [Solobacterium sp.]|jgi:cell division protein FtsL|nr:hypothetical protein [Solobacterium sp.]MBR3365297.1 hypothetical protein [Solobacterium sp.]
MAKIVKRKKGKKSLRILTFSVTLFLFSALLYLASSLFLRSYNNELSARKQEITSQIAVLETQNDAIEVEISQLASAERVDDIAANNGMSRNQDAIITITSDSSEDGE